jgi:hypothetical protein
LAARGGAWWGGEVGSVLWNLLFAL